jgi:hypothetical protein
LWKFFLKQTSESNVARGASQPLPSPVSAMIVDSLLSAHEPEEIARPLLLQHREGGRLFTAFCVGLLLTSTRVLPLFPKAEGERGVMKRGAYPTMKWCAAYLPLPGTHVSQGEPTRFACTKQFAGAMIQHA